MHSQIFKIFIVLIFFIYGRSTNAEMTIEKFIFDDSKPLYLKILEVLPKEAIIQIGSKNSENTIIEFMDYFCVYCKKMQSELEEIVNEREDVRVIFLQYPILNESSNILSKMVLAANYQGKGFELHRAIFSTSGSLTHEKLQLAIKESGVNEEKLKIDMSKDETEKILHLLSFIGGGVGARGTPSLFVNENFSPGYISKSKIISLLK